MGPTMGLFGLFVLLAGPIMAQRYLDLRHHSYREMKEYMQLIKALCPSK